MHPLAPDGVVHLLGRAVQRESNVVQLHRDELPHHLLTEDGPVVGERDPESHVLGHPKNVHDARMRERLPSPGEVQLLYAQGLAVPEDGGELFEGQLLITIMIRVLLLVHAPAVRAPEIAPVSEGEDDFLRADWFISPDGLEEAALHCQLAHLATSANCKRPSACWNCLRRSRLFTTSVEQQREHCGSRFRESIRSRRPEKYGPCQMSARLFSRALSWLVSWRKPHGPTSPLERMPIRRNGSKQGDSRKGSSRASSAFRKRTFSISPVWRTIAASR